MFFPPLIEYMAIFSVPPEISINPPALLVKFPPSVLNPIDPVEFFKFISPEFFRLGDTLEYSPKELSP